MTPYSNLLYFAVVLYPVAATLALRVVFGRGTGWHWILGTSVVMLTIQFWRPIPVLPDLWVHELVVVACYSVLQWAILLLFRRRRAGGKSTPALAAAVVAALLPLAVTKFAPLVSPDSTPGFLGISYVTFRALDVLFGIHDGLIDRVSVGRYMAFLFFFPTISAGPIDRYRRFDEERDMPRTRGDLMRDLETSAHLFINGLWFKFVLAALVKQYWLDPSGEASSALGMLSYMYAYSAYLFFDFSGYTDFALAISHLFGVHPPGNFKRPYLARNIADFWNRWHISLSHWFRDHIYMRLTVAAARGRWFRSTIAASTFAFFVTFGLMGIWHGLTVHFVLYGLFHAVLLSAHTGLTRWGRRARWWGRGWWWPIASWFVTFNLVCFGFLLFSGHLIAR